MKAQWKDYFELMKPRVVMLMLLTAFVGMILASDHFPPLKETLLGLIGIGLAAGAAATLNHLVDKKIDSIMARTAQRPVATGKISASLALLYAFILGLLGLGLLAFCVNHTVAWLTFFSLIGYAGFYTLILKRATPQNIVIGGLAGAAPPLLGWSAITNSIDPHALLLVLIIFVWTPPHFWALAIYREAEYRQANIPMLPVTHGIPFTKLCIFLYTLLLTAITLLPFATQMSGIVYVLVAMVLNAIFLKRTYVFYRSNEDETRRAKALFVYSITYLNWLFVALIVDHTLKGI